ncbi:MAG: OmpW family protein, partial [Mesorhizobium sp.]
MATKRMNVLRGVTAAVILLLVGQQAVAADLPEIPYDPQEAASVEWPSPWQIRLRALGVITEDSGYVNAVPGSGLSYSDTVTPELDISYFFTDNIAA